jgi:hypothetical protein
MKNISQFPRLLSRIVIATAALAVLFVPLTMFGQSCSLCYTQAAASTLRFIQALRNGILILMIPPMFMSVGITVMTYKRRNTFRSSDQSE